MRATEWRKMSHSRDDDDLDEKLMKAAAEKAAAHSDNH
jgi:hypothetical protein